MHFIKGWSHLFSSIYKYWLNLFRTKSQFPGDLTPILLGHPDQINKESTRRRSYLFISTFISLRIDYVRDSFFTHIKYPALSGMADNLLRCRANICHWIYNCRSLFLFDSLFAVWIDRETISEFDRVREPILPLCPPYYLGNQFNTPVLTIIRKIKEDSDPSRILHFVFFIIRWNFYAFLRM